MMANRVAVVTGANRGIGFAIAKQLCAVFDGTVLLTARDQAKGEKAVAELAAEGLECKSHVLDVTSSRSIECLKEHLVSEYGGIDALINNAGIAFTNASTVPFAEQAEVTLQTNFWGAVSVCTILRPILKPNSRVVNITSSLGILSQVSKELQEKFSSPTCTGNDVCMLAEQFVRDVKEGKHKEQGWSNTAYGIGEVATIAYTKALARDVTANGPDGCLVNACCPGWVRTDMAGNKAPDSPEQGADVLVYCATLPAGASEPHGDLVKKRTVRDWMTISRFK